MEKSLLIGAIVKEVGNDSHLMIVDKVSVAYNNTITTVYLAVDNKGKMNEIAWDEILEVISFPVSTFPSEFIKQETQS